MSVFDAIRGQQDRTNALGARIIAVRDRLIGATLPAGIAAAPASIFEGELGALENAGNAARVSVEEAHAALDDLERIFG